VNLTEAYTRVHYGSDPSQPMTVSPSLFGNARVSYAFGGDAPTLGLAAVFLAKRPADRAYDGGFSVMPYAPADLELRTTVSGHLPGVERLRYRLSVSFASAAHSAYVIGPYLYAVDATTRAELAPMTRLQGFLGLEYVLF
jgi:hypothetical protein